MVMKNTTERKKKEKKQTQYFSTLSHEKITKRKH